MKGLVIALVVGVAPLAAQAFDVNGGQWAPSTVVIESNECSKAIHDTYSAIGVDGVRFHTWHPPVHESGCAFGHEHGDNPADYVGPDSLKVIRFGEANYLGCKAVDAGIVGAICRKEDHVGNKIRVENRKVFTPQNVYAGNTLQPLTCDIITKLHQGTHSPDAITNNLHELIKRQVCDDGTYVNVTFLAAIGPAGAIQQACSPQTKLVTGAAVPENSPTRAHPRNPGGSMGNRLINTPSCIRIARPMTMPEAWKSQNTVECVGGARCYGFADYWFVSNSARFYDMSNPNKIAYMINECWRQSGVEFVIKYGDCVNVRRDAAGVPYGYTDVRSPFNGTRRSVRFDGWKVHNLSGHNQWCTDVLGGSASLTCEVGDIVQIVSLGTHPLGQWTGGTSSGRNYGHPTVHAPN